MKEVREKCLLSLETNNFTPKNEEELLKSLGIGVTRQTLQNYKKLTDMIPELEELVDKTTKEIEEFEKNCDNKQIEKNIKMIIRQTIEGKELKKEDIQQLVNMIEIDENRNILIHFNFYELNCIGGYLNYDDSKKAINS